jgi:hypothetical protein
MILKQALGRIDQEPDSSLLEDIAFREKDAVLLREECAQKYETYTTGLVQVFPS